MTDLALTFGKPFNYQLAALRLRFADLHPTAKWDDIWQDAHNRAFMVAGAIKADLVADLGRILECRPYGSARAAVSDGRPRREPVFRRLERQPWDAEKYRHVTDKCSYRHRQTMFPELAQYTCRPRARRPNKCSLGSIAVRHR